MSDSAHAQAIGAADALKQDAALIAADMGWPLANTIDHLRAQEVFAELVHQLETAHPTSFSDSVFAPVPGQASTIYFKGSVPASAVTAANATGLNIALDGGAPFSASEMEAQIDLAGDYMDSKGYTNYVLSFVDDTLEVTVGNGEPAPVFPGTVTASVVIELNNDPVVWFDSAAGRGGLRARTPAGSDQCTTSFTVRDVNTNVTGVSTAEHCGPLGTVVSPINPAVTTALSFQAEHFGAQGDVQWHSTINRPDVPEYWANESGWIRQVNSVKQGFSRNDWTCFFGRSSNTRFCTQVRRRSVSMRDISYSTTRVRRLVSTFGTLTQGGDSGGPWTNGTRAHGVHSGAAFRNGRFRAFYTRATRMEDALGVEIVLQ